MLPLPGVIPFTRFLSTAARRTFPMGAAALIVLLPPCAAFAAGSSEAPLYQTTAERINNLAMSGWFIACFFVVGAAVGSFLNVVVYRLPRRLNLLWPGSRCPRCGTPIRLTDNIPILSWLRLRGKCRACALPIPARYVLVETLTAAIFLVLALGELLSGGANLPLGPIYPRSGVYWVLWETKWPLVGLYFYHVCLLSLLLSVGLIAWDRLPIPRRLLGFGFAVALFSPLFFPALRPLPWSLALSSNGLMWRGLVDGLLGYVVGLGCGGLLGWAVATRGSFSWRSLGAADTLALVGAFLGWQAVVGVTLWTAILLTLDTVWSASTLHPRRWPVAAAIGPAVWVQLALWRWLQARFAVDDPSGGMTVTAMAAAALCVLAAADRCVTTPVELPATTDEAIHGQSSADGGDKAPPDAPCEPQVDPKEPAPSEPGRVMPPEA